MRVVKSNKAVKPIDERLMTVDEVAEQLQVSRRQVMRWLDERRIRFVQLPRGRRVPESALDEFLNSRVEQPAA